MAINKVEFDGKSLIDLTSDTVTTENLLSGATAHDKAGNPVVGIAKIPTKVSELENDSQFVNAQQVLEAIYKLVSPYIVVNSMQGDTFTIPDCSNFKLQNLKIFGKTIQDGVPTPEKPVPLISVGYNGKVPVKIDEVSIDIPTLNGGINGVPVQQGENYIFNNKRWLCDEIDLKRGVYIQNLKKFKIDDKLNWQYSAASKRFYAHNEWGITAQVGSIAPAAVCTHLKVTNQNDKNTDNSFSFINTGQGVAISIYKFGSDVNKLKQFLKTNDVWFCWELLKPVETPLTEETKKLLDRLTTKYPQTKVSNTYVAGLEATYVADTKNYIDNKNKPIKQAIIESI